MHFVWKVRVESSNYAVQKKSCLCPPPFPTPFFLLYAYAHIFLPWKGSAHQWVGLVCTWVIFWKQRATDRTPSSHGPSDDAQVVGRMQTATLNSQPLTNSISPLSVARYPECLVLIAYSLSLSSPALCPLHPFPPTLVSFFCYPVRSSASPRHVLWGS